MVAAAVAAIGLTGATATVATFVGQAALSYAASSLLKPSAPNATDSAAAREQQFSGGDGVDSFIRPLHH